MKMTKILYLDHSSDFSGGQISLLTLLQLLRVDKFRPVVAVNPNAQMMKKELESLKIPFIVLNFDKISLYRPLQLLRFILGIKKIINEYEIDIIHSNTFMSGLLMAILKPILRKPLIFRARLAIEFHSHGFIDKIIYRRSDLILANSSYVKNTFVKKFGENGKIRTVYNPIIIKPLNYVSPHTSMFVFAILGRVESIKRHLDLVNAVELLSKKDLKFCVWIIGAPNSIDNGIYYRLVHEQIEKKRLNPYFVWKGFVSEPMRLAKNINACISCTIGEALSRSIFECQLHGIPVLASRSGGNTEIIDDEKTGFLFNPGDIYDLALKMEFLIQCPEPQLLSVKTLAKEQVLKLFDEQNTVRKEEKLYIDVTINSQ